VIKVNGSSPFINPATGQLIAPGQVYHVPDPVEPKEKQENPPDDAQKDNKVKPGDKPEGSSRKQGEQ